MSTQPTILDLFAGPGGWDRGAELAGIDPKLIEGIELCASAVETARAAGYNCLHANVQDPDPAEFDHVTDLIASAPCLDLFVCCGCIMSDEVNMMLLRWGFLEVREKLLID